MRLIGALPRIAMPKRARARKLMRGRPLNDQEFTTFLEAVPRVRDRDTESWRRFLNGLWLSGLRLTESVILSWDHEQPFIIDLEGRHPRFHIYGEAEKGGKDRYLPMTPDFAEFILRTPQAERRGLVFKLGYAYRGIVRGVHGGVDLAADALARSKGFAPTAARTTVQANKRAGDAARDAIALREAPAAIEQNPRVTSGLRRIDVLKEGDAIVAFESKVGRTSLGRRAAPGRKPNRIRQELARDIKRLRSGQVDEVVWEFARSATTGKIGPTAPLLRKLQQHGITVRITDVSY